MSRFFNFFVNFFFSKFYYRYIDFMHGNQKRVQVMILVILLGNWITFRLLNIIRHHLGSIYTYRRTFQKWVRNFCRTPRNPIYGQKFLPQCTKNSQKFRMKFHIKLHNSAGDGEKKYPEVLTKSFGLNLLISKIFWLSEISTALGIFLDFLSCGSKNFQK